MAKVDLRRLDMTLLLALSSLLRTRQVTATAAELGLIQSSVSHVLGRLRDVFDDPLFVRRPFGMAPTQRALELEPIVEAILDLSHQALAPAEFDLAGAEGVVRIAALDHHCALVAGPLIERLRDAAPRVRLSFRALARRPAVDALLAGKIDIGLGLFWNLPETVERVALWRDRYSVVGAKTHWSGRELSMDAYLAARHLLVSLDGGFEGVVDKALAEIGCERRVVATVPYFLSALAAAGANDGILTIPRGFADRYADRFGLQIMEAPLALQPFEMCAIHRGRNIAEPLAAVVVDALMDIGRDFEGSDAGDLSPALRRGCGRMQDLEPENDFKRG